MKAPDRPWILVTSELRAAQPTPTLVEMPHGVAPVAEEFPHIVAVRAYGSTARSATAAVGYLTLPVHRSPVWVPLDFLVSVGRLWRYGRAASAVWVMWPGVLAMANSIALSFTRTPVVLNVVGDPYEATQKGVTEHPMRVPARLLHRVSGRLLARRAKVIRYVNAKPLMQLCPPGKQARVFVLSDVDVATVHPPRQFPPHHRLRLVTVGSMDQPYKGVDTLIRATRLLQDRGHALTLTVVGGGRLTDRYEAMARDVLPGAARFTGSLPSAAEVADEVATHDVFVLASLTEGMPRAMIEAMSLGLPCVGTRVGGIPGLVQEAHLASPGDPVSLANAIEALITNSHRYEEAAVHSVTVARSFSRDSVEQVRREFVAAVDACRVGDRLGTTR